MGLRLVDPTPRKARSEIIGYAVKRADKNTEVRRQNKVFAFDSAGKYKMCRREAT
jgi:hypothetical protein